MTERPLAAFNLDVTDHIATVTLTGPGKGNAMGPDFWRECPEVFRMLDADERVRVVVVHGAGKAFSYGLDLLAMAGDFATLLQPNAGPLERARLTELIASMQGAPSALAQCRKPVVAAVHGWCIGGALDLIAAADIRVCSTTARFSLREVKVGMVADVGSLQRLPHVIGESATRELALTGRDIDASRAHALGLVSEVFSDDDALFAGARALAQQIAKNPPLVVQGIKRVMNARIDGEVARGLAHVAMHNAAFLGSEDLHEAVAAFMEKRDPVFKGK
jgi:enoyl-CoA hydratase